MKPYVPAAGCSAPQGTRSITHTAETCGAGLVRGCCGGDPVVAPALAPRDEQDPAATLASHCVPDR